MDLLHYIYCNAYIEFALKCLSTQHSGIVSGKIIRFIQQIHPLHLNLTAVGFPAQKCNYLYQRTLKQITGFANVQSWHPS